MSAHTPEPWRYSGGSVYQAEPEDTLGYPTSAIAHMDRENPNTYGAERDANAKRIVACVNACAGIADPSALAPPERVEALHRAAGDVLDWARMQGGWEAPCWAALSDAMIHLRVPVEREEVVK